MDLIVSPLCLLLRRLRRLLLPGFVFLLSCGALCSLAQDTFFFDPAPASQEIQEGRDLLVRCDVSNRYLISFYWTFNGKALVNTTRRYQSSSDLQILNVDRNLDSGSFRCVAVNVSTGIAVRSGEARLSIQWLSDQVKVVQKSRDDTNTEATGGVTSPRGTDVWLQCEVDANPEPTFHWFRNGVKLFGGDRVEINKSEIRIRGATSGDSGVYSCSARNQHEEQVDSRENYVLSIQDSSSVPRLVVSSFTPSIVARRYSSASLDCQFQQGVATQWYFNQLHLANTTKYYILGNGSLVVNRVDDDDAGVYRCVGTGAGGTSQTFASQLLIAYLNDLTERSFDPRTTSGLLVVPSGAPFEIRCILPDGLPQPTSRWLTPLGRVSSISGGRMKESSNGTLGITRVEDSDAGSYVCEVENLAGTKSRNISLMVSVVPRIIRPPISQSVQEGESVSLECIISATPYPATTVSWRKDGQLIDVRDLRYKTDKSVLKITSVLLTDEGEYSCMVNSKGHTPVTSHSGRLRVTRRLRFLWQPSDVKLLLNSYANISCRADGITPPTVTWYKIGQSGFPSHVRDDRTGSLIFQRVIRSDAGLYVCLATNSQGTINATIRIDFFVTPTFMTRPGNVTGVKGKVAMLHCSAKGEPQPTIQWTKTDSDEPLDSPRLQVMSNGTLYISSVSSEDEGTYQCIADNGGAKDHVDAHLFVQDFDPGSDAGMTKTIVIAICSVAAYLGVMIGVTVFCVVRRMRRQTLQTTTHSRISENTQLMRKAEKECHGNKSDGDSRSQSSQNSHLLSKTSLPFDMPPFSRQNLHVLGLLGKCHYGDVFLAHNLSPGALCPLVSVKSLTSLSGSHQVEFQKELELFTRSSHNNLARLAGVCCALQPPIIAIEYCEWGDLKQFLQSLNTETSRIIQSTLTLAQQLEMCRQVALGMEHLSTNHLVHGDLAARNVLITPHLDLKISLLSLCRDIHAGDYVLSHDRLIPLRWMPPEAVFHGDRSTSADIWAFGVFVTEVFEFGMLPLVGKSNEEILVALKTGSKLHVVTPEGCPESLWKLVQRCTQGHPNDRPSFTDVVNVLGCMVCDSGV